MNEFDPKEYYASYPTKVISRPGYPARAAFKSTLMFETYGQLVFREIDFISNYADIGGCFGFGANSMAFQITRYQEKPPRTLVFEISPNFIDIGRRLFPNIEFVNTDFHDWDGDIDYFDLVTLFDVVEHVVDPAKFLKSVSSRCRYLMLITPMETTGDLFGSLPPKEQGNNHPDGHINFFTPYTYRKLLDDSGLDIIEQKLTPNLIPKDLEIALLPENQDKTNLWTYLSKPKIFTLKLLHFFPGIPWEFKRKILGGGNHLALCKSRFLGQSLA